MLFFQRFLQEGIVDPNIQTSFANVPEFEISRTIEGFGEIDNRDPNPLNEINLETIYSSGMIDFSVHSDTFSGLTGYIFQLCGTLELNSGNFGNFENGLRRLGLWDLRGLIWLMFFEGDGILTTNWGTINFSNKTINDIFLPIFPAQAIFKNFQTPTTTSYNGNNDEKFLILNYISTFAICPRGDYGETNVVSIKQNKTFIPNKPILLAAYCFPFQAGLYRIGSFVEVG